MNYYELLEVLQSASPEIISMAYKTLAKKYHPDTYIGDKVFAVRMMQKINEAYETLSDEVKRKEYDNFLASSPVDVNEETSKAHTQKKVKIVPQPICIILITVVTCIVLAAAISIFINFERIKKLNEQEAFEQAASIEASIESSLAEKREEDEKKAVAEKQRKEYLSALNQANTEIAYSLVTVETVCTIVKNVWYDSIHEIRNDSTIKYTCNNQGAFHENFSIALNLVYRDEEIKNHLSEIAENRSSILGLMKQLLNPTPEFEQCFDSISALYEEYISFTNLAISPWEKTYDQYMESFIKSEEATISLYQKLQPIIPAQ